MAAIETAPSSDPTAPGEPPFISASLTMDVLLAQLDQIVGVDGRKFVVTDPELEPVPNPFFNQEIVVTEE